MFADHARLTAAASSPPSSRLVPTHGLHVTAGCIWLVIMLVQIAVFGLDDRVKVNLLRLGLFWHFLDIIWVAIFSVVYLQGMLR